MAMTLGDVIVNIRSDTSQLTKGFKRAESTVSKASRTMSNAIKTIAAAYIGLNAIDLVGNLVKQADAMTLINTRLKLATKSTEELVKAQKELFDISQEARVSFSGTVDLFERIARSTRDYGTSQKEIIGLTETINKAMVISGGTAQSMNAAIIQLGQAFSADFQAVGQELASIREQAPRLYQALLEGTELSSKAFKKHAEDGKLSTQIIIDALKSQSESVETEFEKVNLTVDQSQTRLKNSSLKIIGAFDEITGASSFVAESISDISKSMDELDPQQIEDFANVFLATVNDIKIVASALNEEIEKTGRLFEDATNPLDSFNIELFNLQNSAVGAVAFISTMNAALENTSLLFENAGIGVASLINYFSLSSDEYEKYAIEAQKEVDSNRLRVKSLEEIGNAGLEAGEKLRKSFLEADIAREKLKDKPRDEISLPQTEVESTKTKKSTEDNLKLLQLTNKAQNEATKALEAYNKELQQAQDGYIAIVGTDYDKWLLDTNKKLIALAKTGSLSEKQLQKVFDTLSQDFTDSLVVDKDFSEILQGEIESAFSNVRDFEDFADAFGSAIGSALANATTKSVSELLGGGVLGSLGGGIIGAGIGMLTDKLFSGDDKDRETATERADKAFDKFMNGLDSASQALEQFGNIGSSISGQIETLQTKISAELKRQEHFRKKLSEATTKHAIGVWSRGILDREREIQKYKKELSEVVKSSLADTLDISALSTSKLQNLTAGIDVEAMKAMDTELNNIALSMKTGASTAEDIARATEILSDAEFAKYQDFSEAFDLLAESTVESTDTLLEAENALIESRTRATKLINQEMLGTLSHLSDVEKLSFANNIYRDAITPEDRVSSSRTIAEISRGTTRTREDYAPIFAQYLNEIQKQGEEATTQDVVDKLDEVIGAISDSADSATEDSIYGT